MATFLSKLWNKFSSKQPPLSVMIIGLDDSGKTSILNTLIAASSNSLTPFSANATRRTLDDDTDKGKTSNLSESDQPLGTSVLQRPEVGHGERHHSSVKPTIGYNYERIRYRNHTVNLLDFSGQSKYRVLWQEFFNCVDGIVFVLDSSDLLRLVVVQDELETVLSHPFFATLTPNVTPPKLSTSATTTDSKPSRQTMAQQFAQKQVVIDQGKLIESPLSDWLKSAPQRGTGSSDGRGKKLRTRIPVLFMANKSDLATSVETQAVVEALKLDQVSNERHPWRIQATSVRTNQGIIDGFDWLVDEILRMD